MLWFLGAFRCYYFLISTFFCHYSLYDFRLSLDHSKILFKKSSFKYYIKYYSGAQSLSPTVGPTSFSIKSCTIGLYNYLLLSVISVQSILYPIGNFFLSFACKNSTLSSISSSVCKST